MRVLDLVPGQLDLEPSWLHARGRRHFRFGMRRFYSDEWPMIRVAGIRMAARRAAEFDDAFRSEGALLVSQMAMGDQQ